MDLCLPQHGPPVRATPVLPRYCSSRGSTSPSQAPTQEEEQAMSDAQCLWSAPAQTPLDIHPPPVVGAAQAQHSGPDAIVPLHVRLLGGFCIERSDVGRAVSDWP